VCDIIQNIRIKIKQGGICMSIESAKSFIDRMKTDEEFARKVTACKNTESRMAFVKEAGFTFTAEDIKLAGAELTDDEVMEVSGGGPCWIELVLGCKSVQMGNMLVA
jgi:predicted ribosomally synthesized peptide with nif11-like leader